MSVFGRHYGCHYAIFNCNIFTGKTLLAGTNLFYTGPSEYISHSVQEETAATCCKLKNRTFHFYVWHVKHFILRRFYHGWILPSTFVYLQCLNVMRYVISVWLKFWYAMIFTQCNLLLSCLIVSRADSTFLV